MARDASDWISEISSILGLAALVGITTFLILCCKRIYYVYHLRDARREARWRIRSIKDEIRSLRDGDPSIDRVISQALHTIILDRERCLRNLSQIEDSLWISFSAFFRTDPCLRLLEELEQDLRHKVQRMTEAREIRLTVMSANNAHQTDATLPTTADMSNPLAYEAGITPRPAESASRTHSTTAESMNTDPGDPSVMVTTRPEPSHLPVVPTLIDEQARRQRESWTEVFQMLERTAKVPESRHKFLSAHNARQTDSDLPPIARMPSPTPLETGVTRWPVDYASQAFSTAIESTGTDTAHGSHRVTTRTLRAKRRPGTVFKNGPERLRSEGADVGAIELQQELSNDILRAVMDQRRTYEEKLPFREVTPPGGSLMRDSSKNVGLLNASGGSQSPTSAADTQHDTHSVRQPV